MRRNVAVLIVGLLMLPAVALAGSDTEQEVRQAIVDGFAFSRENLRNQPDVVSMHGSVEFWSSGGLMMVTKPDATPEAFDSFNLHPKHIKVVPLVEGEAALAMYYSEGSLQPKGYPAVSHYLTRVMEIYVKEDGKWKLRAAHWSPVQGGSGTSQTAE